MTDLVRYPARTPAPYYGQDGNYQVPLPAYGLSQDGLVVMGLNTGLTWQQADDGVKRD